ncbi:MAG: exonuclease domain-containing protein [Pseudomonadota bacterium]
MHDFYAIPFPPAKAPCSELEFVALDLETTGLEPQRDEILSIGLVRLQGLEIDLQSASHRLIRPRGGIPEESAVIHHITDDRAATGEPLQTVLEAILPLLAGKVLIAHHARFEMQFLQRACERCFGTGFLMPVIDTQEVARRTLERRSQAYQPKRLRLAELRREYGLPHYRLHNALSDALAAGELFLAQLAQYDADGRAALKNFLLKV